VLDEDPALYGTVYGHPGTEDAPEEAPAEE
jgi:hypothetical protein